MSANRSDARTLAELAILALFALQFVWHAGLVPPRSGVSWFTAAVFALPLLPVVVLVVLRHRRAAFWGALAALLYFCHGVTEVWMSPALRGFAWVEIALAVSIVVAGSWDGLRARLSRRSTAGRMGSE